MDKVQAYYERIPLAGGETSPPQAIVDRKPPSGFRKRILADYIALCVNPDGAGTGRIEITFDDDLDNATWESWPNGDVSAPTHQMAFNNFTAWRAVCVSGNINAIGTA